MLIVHVTISISLLSSSDGINISYLYTIDSKQARYHYNTLTCEDSAVIYRKFWNELMRVTGECHSASLGRFVPHHADVVYGICRELPSEVNV